VISLLNILVSSGLIFPRPCESAAVQSVLPEQRFSSAISSSGANRDELDSAVAKFMEPRKHGSLLDHEKNRKGNAHKQRRKLALSLTSS
jgi:hypothetical protein